MQEAVATSMLAGEAPRVRILIQAVEEGGFTAECPDIPGCVSEGDTEAEAEANIRKAIDACLSVIFEDLLARIKPAEQADQENVRVSTRQKAVAVTLPRLADAAA